MMPAWETLPHERLSPRSDTIGRRLQVLRAITGPAASRPRIVVAPVRAVIQPIVSGIEKLEPVHLVRGEEYPFKDVVRGLNDAAYSRVDLVAKRGEYAVRGGIIDVFPPTAITPCASNSSATNSTRCATSPWPTSAPSAGRGIH